MSLLRVREAWGWSRSSSSWIWDDSIPGLDATVRKTIDSVWDKLLNSCRQLSFNVFRANATDSIVNLPDRDSTNHHNEKDLP
jgi:hypothetical protein